ncbi:MAG TPA: NAD-binding protein [Pseudonocardiaceae bacterium]|nr:NAD-binding protein [Pseudonocardiaceae bacterium]
MGTRSTAATLRLWLFVAAAAVLAAVLGAVGFAGYLPTQPEFAAATPADIAYYTAQLFVLDPTPFDAPHRYPLSLEIARFLAPATTIFALVETVRVLLWDRVRRWSAAHAKGHIVVTGDDPVALMLAKRFAAEGERVVLVSDTLGEDVARRHGLFVVAGDPTEQATLRAAGVPRAATVYACGRDSGTNLAVSLTSRRIAIRPVTVRAEIRDARLFADLKAARGGAGTDLALRLSFFAVDELAARALLAQESLIPGHGEQQPVVVFGQGSFAQAVQRQLQRRQNPARPVPVTVVPDADAASWSPPAGSSPRCYICVDDLDLALHTALTQARGGAGRVVLCLQRHSAFREALAGTVQDGTGGFAVFGILDAACDAAPRDPVDEIGRAIHDRYVRSCLARGDTPAANASLVPWAKLPVHLKRSNWAHADDIGAKLATIGSVIVPALDGAEPFTFRPGEVEGLARMEHERWMAERQAGGFVPGPVREGRFHPDLVDWEQLPRHSRDKDIDFVEHLPEILDEAGFQILRL